MATLPHSARPAGGGALNFGVAIVTAGALGFLAFAMPDDIFSGLVAQSGLPGFVEAAQPPLGMKARGAAIVAVAILTFLAVLLLLRGIDRLSARPAGAKAKNRAVSEPETDAPKVRRADAHPDAPSRRPLLAGRDLAEFEEDDANDYPPDDMFADLPAQPLPGFAAGDRLSLDEVDEPESDEESFAEPEIEAEAEPLILETPFEEEVEALESEPLVLETPVEERSVEALVSRLPETDETGDDNAIASLMQRLESGLAEREISSGAPVEIEPAPQARAAPETPSWLAPQPPVAESDEAAAEEEGEANPLVFPSLHAFSSYTPEDAEADEIEDESVAEESGALESQIDEFGELRCTPRRTEKKMVALPTAPLPIEEPAPAAAAPAPEDDFLAIPETQVGHRLRSALGEMRKSAGQGG